jgi:hypothetical protein
MSQAHNVIVSFEAAAPAAALGQWSAPRTWGPGTGVAIHAHLLPDGRVLTFGRHHQKPVVWDPRTGAFSSLPQVVDLFCSGHAFLANGQLLTAGGHSGTDNLGLVASTIFDFSTGTWTRGPDMRNGRWYPTNTTLANGEILTVSGGDTAQLRNEVPEVYQPTTKSWRALARLYLPYYPFQFVVPTGARAGHVFVAGPSRSTYFLNTAGAGAWTPGPASLFGDRSYGTAAMYDVGKVLLVGGGGSTATAEVIDLTAGGPAWRSVGPMKVARRQINATVLADGTVLVTGGTNRPEFNSAPNSDLVLAAELWNPATEQWTQLARMARQRLYHAVALLLPDGRVLSTGSGEPAASGLSDDYSYEIFTPPYLLNADGTPASRPTITSAPGAVAYGASFTVGTPDASAVAKVTWVALGSVTHAFNMSQRFLPLGFKASGASTLTVTAPPDGNHAPPGYYLLFVVDGRGVPSEAKIVRIGA